MKSIVIKNISKIYVQANTNFYALKNVSFEIFPKEFVVLSGPSGSGKSTLLNIIGSLDNASSGEVLINGEDICKKNASELSNFRLHKLGFIFQSYNLLPVLSALENVALSLDLQGLPKKESVERAKQVLSDVGLANYFKSKPKELSGGQQQRVAIARALVGNPELILADEPTANLDGKNAESLIAIMKAMKDKYNTTIISSSHDDRVIKQAERLIKLRDGEIV